MVPRTPSPKKRVKEEALDDELLALATPSKKAKPAKAAKIPTSASELSEGDRLIIELKEAGQSWASIDKAYSEKTGVMVSKGFSCKRYSRLKAALSCVKDEDKEHLLSAKEEVEEEIKQEKAKLDSEVWARTAAKMAEKGVTEKYSTILLQKEYKQLTATPVREKSAATEATTVRLDDDKESSGDKGFSTTFE